MKTIQVHDFTWKTLQEMKLERKQSTLNAVIDQLIIESASKKVK
jgi:predicted CopG family antitoxin